MSRKTAGRIAFKYCVTRSFFKKAGYVKIFTESNVLLQHVKKSWSGKLFHGISW